MRVRYSRLRPPVRDFSPRSFFLQTSWAFLLAAGLVSVSACHKRPVTTAVPAAPAPQAPSQPAASQPAASRPATGSPAPAPQSIAPQTAAPAPEPAAPSPKLGDVLTAAQQRQLNVAIDQSIGRAQASLNSIGRRQLPSDQQAVVDQVRNFIQQARELRNSDLAAARSLAERAEVLARDLAARVH